MGEFGSKDPENPYNKLFRIKHKQALMLNLVNQWETQAYRFDWLVGILVVITWLRLLFSLRISKSFGPLFKVI